MPTATSQVVSELRRTIARAIYGKEEAIQLALITLLARGHLLIEDVPGVGKTTLAQALAKSFQCGFQRVQFTSDLLPSDVLGVSVYNPETRDFEFRAGPIFANVVLADEINRTTPRTQSALLEAMNDAQVTVDGKSMPLPNPFLVIATQNPVEHHGTYPLPESQLDRFLMRIKMGYPSHETEKEILRKRANDDPLHSLQPVADVSEVLAMQEAVTHVKVDGSLQDYALEIVNRTRNSEQLALGVSPRGTLMLQRAAQARAFLDGRDFCLPDDFKHLAVAVFAHRVVASARHASLQRKSETTENALREIVESVRVPL
ncbi:MAG: MoxR family ATPase [Acidobacteria bacterium]|nr:MoxR family ATPase [Acidobacteriota bacterium]MBS1867133.1 MoxR family ATPase [Acidobacteriota bacterium]